MTMKTDERNKFAIKSFLGEYLDLKEWNSKEPICGFLFLPSSWRHLD